MLKQHLCPVWIPLTLTGRLTPHKILSMMSTDRDKGELRTLANSHFSQKLKRNWFLLPFSSTVWQFDACVFLSACRFTSALWLNVHIYSLEPPRDNRIIHLNHNSIPVWLVWISDCPSLENKVRLDQSPRVSPSLRKGLDFRFFLGPDGKECASWYRKDISLQRPI